MIDKSLNKMNKNSLLFISESPILMDKSTRLFILSKCKEMNIQIITASH